MQADEIISFWFKEIPTESWFKKDADFDRLIEQRFLQTHQAATAGELNSWRSTSLGRLAEIIVLDQFSRNIFQDMPSAFAWDGQALVLAQEAVAMQALEELETSQQSFLIMP